MKFLSTGMLFAALMISATTAFATDYSSCESDNVILTFRENADTETRAHGYTKDVLLTMKSGGVPLMVFAKFTEKGTTTVYESQPFDFLLTVAKKGKGKLVLEGHTEPVQCK